MAKKATKSASDVSGTTSIVAPPELPVRSCIDLGVHRGVDLQRAWIGWIGENPVANPVIQPGSLDASVGKRLHLGMTVVRPVVACGLLLPRAVVLRVVVQCGRP